MIHGYQVSTGKGLIPPLTYLKACSCLLTPARPFPSAVTHALKFWNFEHRLSMTMTISGVRATETDVHEQKQPQSAL